MADTLHSPNYSEEEQSNLKHGCPFCTFRINNSDLLRLHMSTFHHTIVKLIDSSKD